SVADRGRGIGSLSGVFGGRRDGVGRVGAGRSAGSVFGGRGDVVGAVLGACGASAALAVGAAGVFGGACLTDLLALGDGGAELADDDVDGAHAVVVAGDRDVGHVRIAVGVDEADGGD